MLYRNDTKLNLCKLLRLDSGWGFDPVGGLFDSNKKGTQRAKPCPFLWGRCPDLPKTKGNRDGSILDDGVAEKQK